MAVPCTLPSCTRCAATVMKACPGPTDGKHIRCSRHTGLQVRLACVLLPAGLHCQLTHTKTRTHNLTLHTWCCCCLPAACRPCLASASSCVRLHPAVCSPSSSSSRAPAPPHRAVWCCGTVSSCCGCSSCFAAAWPAAAPCGGSSSPSCLLVILEALAILVLFNTRWQRRLHRTKWQGTCC